MIFCGRLRGCAKRWVLRRWSLPWPAMKAKRSVASGWPRNCSALRECPQNSTAWPAPTARRAVALVARCRGCAQVYVERRPATLWRRWLHGDTLQGLLRLPMPLTYLTLSGQALPPETEVVAARAKVVRDGQDVAPASINLRVSHCETGMKANPNR